MPVFGKLDLQTAVARAPLMRGFDTDAWELKGAEILQLSYEIAEEPAEHLIPPALHPSIPPYATLSVARFPASPVGPFSLAQVRIIVRAGIRPRGYLLQAYTDAEQAATELRARWGFTIALGKITLQARHDRVIGHVERDGQPILAMELENPEQISGSDITYLDSLHLARVIEGGQETPIIVQVDPEYVFHSASRGRPRLNLLQTDAWGGNHLLRCTSPMAATYTRCDTDLPKLRFALNPAVPAIEGSRRLAA
ncbi:MAG: acetoacetate decarboxylase family protein [Candidatus Binatia bacterium]|nr:acetoacetate decarboxylase family protein [Candidatus Binatia bacterium]